MVAVGCDIALATLLKTWSKGLVPHAAAKMTCRFTVITLATASGRRLPFLSHPQLVRVEKSGYGNS